jgi:hypothetical protein
MDEAFVVTRQVARAENLEPELLYPYAYRGTEVNAFVETVPGSLVIYPYSPAEDGTPTLVPEGKLRERYPHIHARLVRFKERLRERRDSRKLYATGNDWYRHLRPGTFGYIASPKLLVKGVSEELTCGRLSGGAAFNGANCPALLLPKAMTEEATLVLLALMNSRMLTYHLLQIAPAKLGGYLRFNANSLNSIPIAAATPRVQASIARACADAAALEAELASGSGGAVEARMLRTKREALDSTVYELYGLSDAEIQLVEAITSPAATIA